MPSIKKLVLASGLMLAMMASAMAASVTYHYEGLPFNGSNDPNGLLNGYNKITASITFDQPYEDDSAFVPNIISYTISANGVDQLTQLNSTLDNNTFFIFKARISTPGTSMCFYQ